MLSKCDILTNTEASLAICAVTGQTVHCIPSLLPSLQFYIMSMSVFGLGMVAWFFFRCVGQNFQSCDTIMPGPLAFILTLFGVFEGFLFSLFTCIMFCTQVHAICTDETVSNYWQPKWLCLLVGVPEQALGWLSPKFGIGYGR